MGPGMADVTGTVFVGIDGGGSKTHALALDARGDVVFEGRGGPTNWTTVPEAARRQALHDCLRGCPPASAVVGCFAGLMSPEQTADCEAALARALPGARASARPDFHAALAACPDGTDAMVIAGTGSLIASLIDGKVEKSGGGGWRLGDHGSATAIGRAALAELLMPSRPESEGGHERLWEGVEAVYGTRRFREVIGVVYGEDAPAARFATYAPHVFAAWPGDPIAAAVVDEQLARLAGQTALHLRRWRPGAAAHAVRLVGGVWAMAPAAVDRFARLLSDATGTPAVAEPLLVAPALGAARLAACLAGDAPE